MLGMFIVRLHIKEQFVHNFWTNLWNKIVKIPLKIKNSSFTYRGYFEVQVKKKSHVIQVGQSFSDDVFKVVFPSPVAQ